jgi:hypothetical protein
MAEGERSLQTSLGFGDVPELALIAGHIVSQMWIAWEPGKNRLQGIASVLRATGKVQRVCKAAPPTRIAWNNYGKRSCNLDGQRPMLRGNMNRPAHSQDLRVSTILWCDLLQLRVGFVIIAKFKPPLRGQDPKAVWWLKYSDHVSSRKQRTALTAENKPGREPVERNS